jgi:hypothetical protein
MKEIRNRKRRRKKKKILADRTNPAQQVHLIRRPAWQILGSAHPVVSPRAPDPPRFSFIFSIFQNLSPLKHEYLKIYNTFSDPFVSTRS